MTGKEWIIFILNNNLLDENLEDLRINDSFITLETAAVKLGVGTNSLTDMIKLGLVDHVKFDGQIYLHKNVQISHLKRR